MAVKPKKTTRKVPAAEHEELQWPFGPRNYIAFGIALVVIIIGYLCLGLGTDKAASDPTQESFVSITLAPILLVIGYCVLLPIALLIRDRSRADAEEEPAT